jgi:pimeloyl-ACP methyl ester carboxylesterase
VQLYAEEWGPGQGPVVVLVHGVVASSRTWWRLGPALAERGWRVLAVDLRGHGRSPRSPGPFGLDELGADLWETVDAVAGGAPVRALWGHSLGALVAMAAARRRPGAVRQLVLEDPPGNQTADAAAVGRDIRADAAEARRDPAAFLARQRRDNPSWAEGDVLAREDVARCQDDVVALSVEDGLLPDLTAWVGELEVPALLIVGAEAAGSMIGGGERAVVLGTLPADRVVELDAGHAVHREAFEGCLTAVTRWLGRP